ncbi:MAG: acyl-CoA dehydrogenase family protein [Gammaproteobacteria bacterium]|nr:acyl-CoA dehydrogenase family protein [Gammaproteobacteria bacterium]
MTASATKTEHGSDLEAFRAEVRTWLKDNFPPALEGIMPMMEGGADGSHAADLATWRDRLAERGWGAPHWPKAYGGAGLDHAHVRALAQEMGRVGAINPIPLLAGMGVTMVGPTILEYGTDDQKQRHLPGIASGKVRWCLGLSEPNAGSDLASLSTLAEDRGDHFVVNGQKIWTSGADISQWCGALVRTDKTVAKHKGISFLMLPMDQPGVRTRPIKLISGASPFCETFFDDARAEKDDLLGELNDGWNVIKRLLQHERASQTSAGSPGGKKKAGALQDVAKRYVGVDSAGRLDDPDLRSRLTRHLMDAAAHKLTAERIAAEAKGNPQVGAAASIMKNSATGITQARSELLLEIMGQQGFGWEGDAFDADELATVRDWLWGKAISIYGGSAEVQKNIISKNILGLPETTQKG